MGREAACEREARRRRGWGCRAENGSGARKDVTGSGKGLGGGKGGTRRGEGGGVGCSGWDEYGGWGWHLGYLNQPMADFV